MRINERIYDARHDYDPEHVLHVMVDDAGHLALIAVEGNDVATVKLSRSEAKKLRLALQRFERGEQ